MRRPDDWHHHLRDGPDVLRDTVRAAARAFSRAIIMPNLVPPVTTVAAAGEYRERIEAALAASGGAPGSFTPLMTLYLTDTTTVAAVEAAAASGFIKAFKLYPAGATTNSDSGVTDYAKIEPALRAMAAHGLVLCVHGEVTDSAVDVFDRERVFVRTRLPQLISMAPGLKIVLEHLSTKEAVESVLHGGPNLAGTITPQHLLANRNALLAGGIRPHLYCLPILKTEEDRRALLDALRTGCPRLFLGTDSAPHAIGRKETGCGCAGIFNANAALELYAEAFEEAGALEHLEAFCSLHGPAFYGVPANDEVVTLRRETWKMAHSLPLGNEEVVPFRAAQLINWRMDG